MANIDYYNINPRYINVLKGLIDTIDQKYTSIHTKKPSRKDPKHSQKKKSDLTYSNTLDLTSKNEMHTPKTTVQC